MPHGGTNLFHMTAASAASPKPFTSGTLNLCAVSERRAALQHGNQRLRLTPGATFPFPRLKKSQLRSTCDGIRFQGRYSHRMIVYQGLPELLVSFAPPVKLSLQLFHAPLQCSAILTQVAFVCTSPLLSLRDVR